MNDLVKEDFFKLDKSWTFRVNSHVLKRFQEVAKYNTGNEPSKILRDFMLQYIKENANKSVL